MGRLTEGNAANLWRLDAGTGELRHLTFGKDDWAPYLPKKRDGAVGGVVQGNQSGCAIRGTNDNESRIVPSHLPIEYKDYSAGLLGDCSKLDNLDEIAH